MTSLLACLVLAGCLSSGEPAKERDFGATDLFLPITAFPEGWETVGEISPLGPNSALRTGDPDDAYVHYKPQREPGNVTTYYVYWNATTGQAKGWFDRLRKVVFNDNRVSVVEPWRTPDELSYRSQFADRFHVACYVGEILERRQVCDLIAQYEEFGVEFHSVIGPDTLSVEEFNNIVCQIDALFVARLELSDVPIDCESDNMATALLSGIQ